MSTIIRRLGYATLALAGWAAIMLAMPFLGPSGRQVAVVGDPSAAVRAIARAGGEIVEVRRGAVIGDPGRAMSAILAAGGRIVEVRGRAVLARSSDPGFAASLYRAGAALVLEGRVGAGCGSAKAGA